MNLRLKPYASYLKTFVCFAATFIVAAMAIPSRAFAQAETDATTAAPSEVSAATADDTVEDLRDEAPGLVEIHYPADPNIPYRERRETSAFMFGLNYENFYPSKYTSIIDANNTYQDLFGESEIPMISFDLSYKYNFSLGALVLGGGIGIGRLFQNEQTTRNTLEFSKYNVFVGYIMDSLFKEPYVAPYFNVGTTKFSIKETADVLNADGTTQSGSSQSGNTQTGFFYKAGFLMQLNWIEPDTSRSSIVESGIQNTYLDLFITKYTTSIAKDDPDVETNVNYGAGLRVEF
jgi:hypothetical protein